MALLDALKYPAVAKLQMEYMNHLRKCPQCWPKLCLFVKANPEILKDQQGLSKVNTELEPLLCDLCKIKRLNVGLKIKSIMEGIK